MADYRSRNHVRLPILLDPDRSAYRAFGLDRGSVARVWGLDFVVGPDGKLVWGFWGQGPDDRPDVDELIEAVENASR